MGINYVGLPEDLTLPFFAYRNFKPGQLAFPQIRKYLDGEPSAEIIKHEMCYRDGIALICSEENETYKTTGYLMKFTNPRKAYARIGKSQPEDLYMWKEIEVNEKPANALIGVDENLGSFNNREDELSSYNYRQDHFFNEALELIKGTIEEFKCKEIDEMKDFFKIQMTYMLLWSIIERFCTLSYGYSSIGDNMFKFAQEKSFEYELRTITRKDTIYSSDTLKDRYLDSGSYRQSIKYYYTIRCNVVHKGKSVSHDEMNKLKYSLEELYNLFMAVYTNKLIQNDELLEIYHEKRC